MAEPGINYTPNFNLAKPEQGYKNWGTPLNENADKIDAALKNIRTPGNIGDIKYTVLTEAPPGGAWCDGAEYTQAAFPDIYQMLVDGKLQSTTYTNFASSVSTNGSCGFFALDTATQKFKVPLLKDVYLKAGQAPSMFGAESLPNIKGNIGRIPDDVQNQTNGAFEKTSTFSDTVNAAPTGSINTFVTNFDSSRSSSTYQDGAKVNPDHVVYRAYVVLYSSAAEASVAQAAEFMTALGGKANVDLGNVNPTQSFKDNVIGWGMPDYSAGVAISSSGYTVPKNGWISSNIYQDWASDVNAGRLMVNNITVSSYHRSGGTSGFASNSQYIVPVCVGDIITYTSLVNDVTFYPCKGENNA